MTGAARPCIAILGGSFDPPHRGHLALAHHFCERLQPNMLRVIPTGHPWQKDPLHATTEQRLAMLELIFRDFPWPVMIDRQEIERGGPSYAIDTLRSLRAELGDKACLTFLLGADQLQHLNDWHDWKKLTTFAHLCVATRPGFSIETLPEPVEHLLHTHALPLDRLRRRAHGGMALSYDLAVDISSSTIREALSEGHPTDRLLPSEVVGYIARHQLYSSMPCR